MIKTPIQDFVSLFRTTGTSSVYAGGIRRFLDFVYDHCRKCRVTSPLEQAEYEELAARYLADKQRDHSRDLFLFIRADSEKNAPSTVRSHALAVRLWFAENDIELSGKEKMRVRRVTPRGGRLTNIKFVDLNILREILTFADARIKAFILVAACTGMRIGEIRSLTWACVTFPDRKKFPDKLTELYIPKSKNQSARRVWITREAEDALLAWKNNACGAYLARAEITSKNLGRAVDTSGEKVFPFCVQAVFERGNAILKQFGYFSKDPLTRRNQLNFHRLRGFFKMRVLPVIGSEMSELALGHCDAYGHAYDGIPDGEMEKLFQKCEPVLTIAPAYGASRDMSIQVEEMQKMRSELGTLRASLAAIVRNGGGIISLPISQG
jgi:integrase